MWTTVKLGELCEVLTKGTTPTSIGFKFESSGINFIKIESISLDGKFIKSKFSFINQQCNETLKRSQLKEGDLLFSIAGALGRTAFVTKEILPANTNQALAILRLKKDIEVDQRFLLYVLSSQSIKRQSEENKAGVAQQNLSLGQLKNYEISFPSLEDQRRIVGKLDAAFAEIDKVIKISKNNLKSAEAFFARKNSHAFNNFKNNSKIISIKNVCKNIFAGGDAPKTSLSKIKTKNFNIPIYANAKKDKGLYGFTDVPRVDVPAITIAGRGNVGYTEIREEPFFPIVRLIVLIPNEDLISIHFLKRSILSLDILSSGSAIPQLTVPMIKNYVIPLPSLEEQKKYIEKINKIEAQVFKICDCFSKKISQLEMLKSQILFNALKN